MTFDWREFLNLAQRTLDDDENDEAVRRTAASRAYYAAFCNCRDLLVREEGLDPRSGHEQVWTQLIKQSDPDRRKLGVDGDRLRKERILADYRDRPFTLMRAKFAIQTSDDLHARLDRL